MAMMGEMEEAEIRRRQYQQQAAQPPNTIIEPASLEGGTVNSFMKWRKQGDQDDAVRDCSRHDPPTPDAKAEHYRGSEEQHPVASQVPQSAAIRPPVQLCKPRAV